MTSDLNSINIQACVISSTEELDCYNWKPFIVSPLITLMELKSFLLNSLSISEDCDLKVLTEIQQGSYCFHSLSDNQYLTLEKAGIQNNTKLCLEIKKCENYAALRMNEFYNEAPIETFIDILNQSQSDSTEIVSSSTEAYPDQEDFYITRSMYEQQNFINSQEECLRRPDLSIVIEQINNALKDKNKIKLQIKPLSSLKKSINRISEELNELKKVW
ncbi:unnamed protein product [Blepharisma stoltei]|uniref:Uncharacterized protein n=1 Tax=Blepharisma stoltei TaxID=1481888 RepID=A0AAU9IXR4_9CILI|nr:unnamed protein product [Blepharisma stoltei]